jgi:hypothetical protein
MPGDTMVLRPFEDRHGSQLSAIIADDALWAPADGDDGAQFPRYAGAGAGWVRYQAQAFPVELIDDRQVPETPATNQRIRDEVQSSALVWSLWHRQRCPCAQGTRSAAPAAYLQTFLAVNPQ